MSLSYKYCTNCNLAYELQSVACCTQCGSMNSALFTHDDRQADLTRFLVNRTLSKIITGKINNEQPKP